MVYLQMVIYPSTKPAQELSNFVDAILDVASTILSLELFTLCRCVSCSNSDDNLLKNIELFDKLSLRFNGRIVFIKDVIGSQEICCWSYYGHGQKISEVCCTSIVYGTDKKHTKVSHLH